MQGSVRSKQMEHLIQDGTMEQMAWGAVVTAHHNAESYACNIARKMLRMLEIGVNNNGIKYGLKLCRDTRQMFILANLMLVEDSHLDFCVELVQQSFEARYAPTTKEIMHVVGKADINRGASGSKDAQ